METLLEDNRIMISELIECLQSMKEQYGDMPISTYSEFYDCVYAQKVLLCEAITEDQAKQQGYNIPADDIAWVSHIVII